jgi:tRNA (cmo5U34)-methyltransferase
MNTSPKSSVEEIRDRFDRDVERFSNLETGQTATVDAALALDLIARSAAAATPAARAILDIGCGAGNFTLKALERLPNLDCTLIDLSANMLARANARVSAATAGVVTTIQADIRLVEMADDSFDVIVAAASLHHLRGENEWTAVFRKLYRWLRPGGSFWIFDLVSHEIDAVQVLLWQRYGDYLAAFRGDQYRQHVFAYVEREDSPRPVLFQCELLREAGFRRIDILHKNTCFAAFGASKEIAG